MIDKDKKRYVYFDKYTEYQALINKRLDKMTRNQMILSTGGIVSGILTIILLIKVFG